MLSRLLLLYLLALCSFQSARAVEQHIALSKGWNAVFVELEPAEKSPDAQFGNLPIEQVALWFPSKAKVDSLTDPVAIPNKPSEWLVWHPASHPAAFLNTLKQVQGRRAMLIKASKSTTLTITGSPSFERHEWLAPSFNLKGFDIDSNTPLTFARFFDGSRAHEELKVFKLENDAWKKVSGSDVMRRGEAYWVWCKEGSDFQGPVDLTISTGKTIKIEATSNGTLPVILTVEGSGQDPLPLHTTSRRHLNISVSALTSAFVLRGGGMEFSIPTLNGSNNS